MKKTLIVVLVLIVVIAIGVFSLVTFYNLSLKAVNESESNEIIVEIANGSTSTEIAKVLKENNLIKNELVFRIYTKINNISGMQAGTYKLNQNMDIEKIIECLKKGTDYFPDEITIKFLEGKNMRWIATTIAQNTNNSEEDVFNKLADKEYLKGLIDKYWFLTEDILDENIYYPLEGYLFPDTYKFSSKDVNVEQIFNTMLEQMGKKLETFKTKIDQEEYSVHKILTMASIVELEAARVEDRSGVASVLYNRLKNHMALGSDVTTYYAIKVDMSERDLYQSELNKSNPYNTRGPNMEGKLPIGPIATVSIESIDAALNPKSTDNLYFVADKNGKIYFGKSQAEHNKNIENLKNEGLWYNYE